MNADFPGSEYHSTPWEEDNPELVWHEAVRLLSALRKIQPGSKAAELLAEHITWSAGCAIFFSNLVENKGLSLGDTTRLVTRLLDGEHIEAPPTQGQREVLQHAAAFVFLRDAVVSQKRPLTVDLIKATHKILMSGMQREDGLAVQAGSYRTGPASAGFHLFLPATIIAHAISDLVDEYNKRAAASNEDPFALSAWLSYEFVKVHPFEDGNGRMSRLLLSIALLANGIPFCSALGFSSGHRKARKHYFQCICNADKRGGKPKKLAFVVLCSLRDTMSSFLEALRKAAPDEYRAMGLIV